MNNIYKVGVVIGILALYSLATLGVGCFLAFINDDSTDLGFFISWVLGVVAFLILAIFTLERFELWTW